MGRSLCLVELVKYVIIISMQEELLHNCVKCGAEYRDKDVDAYLCEPCNQERLAIAKELDKKYKTTGRQVKSELQIFDEIAKSKGGGSFVNIKDFGL